MERSFFAEHAQALAIGMLLALFSQITGVNAVLYYGSIIVSEHFPGQSDEYGAERKCRSLRR